MKIKLFYKNIDYAHGVGVRHVVVKCFWEEKALCTIVALNEPLHLAHPSLSDELFYRAKWRFDTVWAG
jgi:hypothetical protein